MKRQRQHRLPAQWKTTQAIEHAHAPPPLVFGKMRPKKKHIYRPKSTDKKRPITLAKIEFKT